MRETAKRLAVHENTVRAYAKQGLLPDARVPGTSFYRFRASDVERLRAQRGAPAVSLAAERRTASPEYATASQLALWPQTNAREAQDRLPELVRRLLFETPGAGQISIRTGDGVALAGKDGVATLERQTQLLPAGTIWFEFGTDKDSKRKATKDYDGRKGEASQDVTFAFVTVRRWQGKDSWPPRAEPRISSRMSSSSMRMISKLGCRLRPPHTCGSRKLSVFAPGTR